VAATPCKVFFVSAEKKFTRHNPVHIMVGGRALVLLLIAWAARADAFAFLGVPTFHVASLRHQAATSSPLRLR
jgi:hypothetical protein